MQRERFFDADGFIRFYRDNTYLGEIDKMKKDVKHGIFEVHRAAYKDSLTRIDAVMSQAATVTTSGMLSKHSGPTVRQGICHHFINDREMKWKK
ncbi:MAG: hypothetical protein IPN13_17215 [Bacteroidetes bacterium]|nr:hypothetical protein [Bacteroidota bacterium]